MSDYASRLTTKYNRLSIDHTILKQQLCAKDRLLKMAMEALEDARTQDPDWGLIEKALAEIRKESGE